MKNIYLVFLFLLCSQLSINSQTPLLNFLNALNQEQIEKAILPMEDTSRETWHFLPGTMYKRAGIALFELDKFQKEKALTFLKSQLSEAGYLKTEKIMGLESVLAEISGDTVFRDPEKYYFAFYGDPKNDALWTWSFEGHHISLNFTILDGKATISPRFLGTNPAMIKHGIRTGERVLANEEDLAFKLISSMDNDQKEQAIFHHKSFNEIITKNESKVEPLDVVGIKTESLNDQQKDILTTLITVYLSTIPEELAKDRLELIKKSEFNNIKFGWAGSTEISKPHYYRIQGDTFLIEFDNSQNNANHIHTVWREFDGDFGRDLIKEHYKHHH